MIAHAEKTFARKNDTYSNPVFQSKRPRYPTINDPFMSTLGLEALSAEIENGLYNEKNCAYENFPYYKKNKQYHQSLDLHLIKDEKLYPRFDSLQNNRGISYSGNTNIRAKESKYPFEEGGRMWKYQKNVNDNMNLGQFNDNDSLDRLDALILHCFSDKNKN